MPLTIKQATAADSQLLTDLGSRSFLEAYSDVKAGKDLMDYIPTAFVKSEIEATISNNKVIFLLAYFDDEAVGYVKLRWDRSHPNLNTNEKNMELERIYVLRNFWKHKMGAALMMEAIQLSKNKNFDYLWLGVWQQNNRAIDFYLKMGFEIFGTKKFYVGEEENDDYVMRLKL
ncbi:MAG: GNAT family N-acetyltransferase, partial [Bacteroidia bacterium]